MYHTQDKYKNIWNDFINKYNGIVPPVYNPDIITLYHTHFNWNTYLIILHKEGNTVGLLPIVNTNKAWVSAPHFSYGGILSEKDLNIDYDKLGAFLKLELSSKQSGYYSFDIEEIANTTCHSKHKLFIRSFYNRGGALKSEKTVSIIHLPATNADMWNTLDGNIRRKINKAIKTGLVAKIGGAELLPDFYKVYIKNIKKLVSLNYRYGFFTDMLSSWQNGDIKVVVAYADDVPVGSALLVGYNGFYENSYFATLPAYRKNYISDLLHWKMIEYIYSQEIKSNALYSFGRSTINSGVYNYKNHWPVTNYPIYTYVNYPDIHKKDWLYKIWRLLPGFVTRPVGGRLVRDVY